MKIVTQLRITLALILLLGLSGAGLSAWNVERSRSNRAQIDLSHAIYETYLTLESHTYQLFKQYGDAIIIGDADQRAGKQALIARIDEDTDRLGQLIAEKIALAGERARPKLATLASIDASVKRLVMRLDRFSPTGSGEQASDWGRLSELLNTEIDQGFRDQIRAALTAEKQDVDRIAASIDASVQRQRGFAGLFGLAAILATLAAVIGLDRRITRPINRLLAGVRRFGEGELSHRMNLGGRDELAEIGSAFDTMAQRVADENRNLIGEKERLRVAVADRTRQLSLMLEDVKRSDASRKRMIADVSHELRTPLTIIKGEADIALRGVEKSRPVYQDALRRVREAANHTARLVDDLLFVARTEAGEVRLERQEMDLRTAVREACDIVNRDVVLHDDTEHGVVHGDPGRIRQALLVLLENARHHGGDRIHVRIGAHGDGLGVSVEDTGPGMSDADKAQAFERFFRGSNAAERYREGTGLGLPVALSIAEAHGGTVTLSDRDGGGLVATLLLP